MLLLLHHLLLILFLDYNVFNCVFSYFDWIRCINSNLRICRAHSWWLSGNNSMTLNTWHQKWISIRSRFEILTCSDTYFRRARLLLIINLLQREITYVFIFWEYNTSFAVSWVFISAVLLILWWVYSFYRWLIFRNFVFIQMELIIIFHNLLLLLHSHTCSWINLGSAVGVLIICQKVGRLVIVRWNLLLAELFLLLFISVLLLHLHLAFRGKLYLTTILKNILGLNV